MEKCKARNKTENESESWSRRRTVGKGRNTGGTDLVSKGAEGMGWGDVWHRGGQPGGRGPQVRPHPKERRGKEFG